MAITEYQDYMDEAQSKGKVASYQTTSADSLPADEDIEFGLAVELNDDGDKAKVFAGGNFYGVALAKEYYDYTDDDAKKQYDEDEPVAIVRKGPVWVEVEDDVKPGETVYADEDTGNFRASEENGDGDKIGKEVKGAAFKSTANSGELAKLELNLPA